MRDDGMTDVELFDTGNTGNVMHVVIIEAMPGIDRKALAYAVGNGLFDALEFSMTGRVVFDVGKGAGMDFDHGRARCLGGIDLFKFRRNEQ